MTQDRQMHDPDTLSRHIANCLGMPRIRVLCVIGGPATGKTRAVKAWLDHANKNQFVSAAYIDCKGLAWGLQNCVARGEVTSQHPRGHYPMFLLNGEEVVVVDEAEMDTELVNRIAVHTSKVSGAFTHRLLVLVFQYKDALSLFDLPFDETLVCDTDGSLFQVNQMGRCY